ncbi:MAG: GvpL/GvpF family gas vesicle protein [Gemmatimonadota bacterium]|nr:GvpL/GvpF family gas vesicle protein [Gemmatimonadota bacterium]
MASGAATGLRLYGVIDDELVEQDFLANQKLLLVLCNDLAAVVAPAAYVAAEPTDDDLADYVRVLDALSEKGPVVPAPPGTVFASEDVVSRWLDVHYGKLHEALAAIDRREDGRPPYEYVRMELRH